VVVVNPIKEPGLVRFKVPSDWKSMLLGDNKIATDYVQPNIGGDIALFQGIAKELIENENIDKQFIEKYTNGFEIFAHEIKKTTWNNITLSSGVNRPQIKRLAKLYKDAKNVVFTWSMGITQHVHGVENVESIEVTKGTSTLKRGFAHMLKNGVVMDVTTVEQAQIAEEAGAVSVMVLDKLPSDVRKAGGVARTASLRVIQEIMDSVTIPVMAKCRIGHVYEAKVLAEANVDMVDESEVLTPADENHHIWKWDFTTPFVNGARSLAEALRRIEEGAAMIRTKGEPGTGNVAEAVLHIKKVND